MLKILNFVDAIVVKLQRRQRIQTAKMVNLRMGAGTRDAGDAEDKRV